MISTVKREIAINKELHLLHILPMLQQQISEDKFVFAISKYKFCTELI